MIIQCPDCQTKMKPKPPASTPEGTRVTVKCRCGTTLRFRMPGKPKGTPDAAKFSDLSHIYGDMFGGGRR